jgi:hypothetical protein
VLCPAFVPTGIAESERNRPAELQDSQQSLSKEAKARNEMIKQAVASGKISAAQVAEMVFDAVRNERFYILTHKKILASVAQRFEDIVAERNPLDPFAVKPGERRTGS